jgi:NAD(P)-dependent dehydrogenase (short-subunit alcohol dehydrogenase family)
VTLSTRRPTVLITGAGRGLGFEFARQYAKEGWKVIGTVRRETAQAQLARLGVEVHRADVAERDSLRTLATGLKSTPIDVLICNAGIYGPRGTRLGVLDYESWQQVLRVNLLGAAATVEALLENVAVSEKKVIVMMSSRLGSIAESEGRNYLYASSKAALNSIAKAMSIDLAPRGITVVSLTPGWVRTDMGGDGAPLRPEVSIAGMRKVIDVLRPEKSGRFFSYDGAEVAW